MPPHDVIPFRRGAEEHASAETEHKVRLFAWADGILQELDFAQRIADANSLDELRKITFDANAAEVEIAIRETLRPTKPDFLVGYKVEVLKRILKMRFNKMKTEREAELRNGRGQQSASASDWTDGIKFDDKGNIRAVLNNYILFLRHHQEWQDVLAYDEFNVRAVIRKRPPWGEVEPDAPFTDHYETQVRVWFQRELDLNAGLGDVGRAVQAAARQHPFHPVQEYLDSLEWDGTPRLDTWLHVHCHADETPYTRAVGRRFPISAVARIYEPGCKVDTMAILEGPQGKQKSEAIRALAVKEAWFTDRLSHVASKDAAIETAGVWLIEVAEMDAQVRASPSAAKGFVTRRVERYRPPYGKHTIPRGRQCVFVGTINPPVGGYLKDPTGARRFWPVACHDIIDLDGIKQDRDQLWAEAVHRFKAGEHWWMDTPELEALAKTEQDARFKTDVWTEPVKRWLGRRRDVSISQVLRGALGIAARDQTRSAEMRVGNILTHMGFTKYRARNGSERQNRYRQHQS
jgi:predicted P-loop ATPase